MLRLNKFIALIVFTSITLSIFAQSTPIPRTFVRWSPDGSLIASIKNGQLEMINAITGQTQSLAPEVLTNINTVSWSRDGQRFAVGLDNGQVSIWQIMNETITQELARLDHGVSETMGVSGGVSNVDWSYTDAYLVTNGLGGVATQIWETVTYTRIFQAITGTSSFAQWSPTEFTLIVANTQDARILDFSNPSNFRTSVYAYAEWDTLTQAIGETITANQPIGTMVWSPSGNKIAVGTWFGEIWIIDVETQAVTFITQVEMKDTREFFSVWGLIWSQDEQFLYGATSDAGILNWPSWITIWEISTGTVTAEFQADTRIREFGVSPFGGRIVIGTAIPQGQSANTPFAGLQFIVPNPTDARLAELTQTCAQAESAVCDADLAAMQA
nr:hypothetical protein [Anaerolineae bacterium]